MLTKHTHREYGNDNYSYEYRYEYDKSNRFAKISVYRYNGGWYLYSYWTAKEWDSLGSVSKFWEYNGQNKVTCIVNLTSSGSRNRYTKMTIVNSSNQTVRTDTWSYDSNGHLPAGPTAATPTAILTCSDSPAITILALATRCSTVIAANCHR